MKKFALLTHSIKHTLSPGMWEAAFKSLNLPYTYEALDIQPSKFESIKYGYDGFGVGVPFKEDIISFLDELTPEAKEIGAVNTILKEGNILKGDNTDWIGVTKALENIPDISSKKVLVYGAGGAAKAAIYALNRLSMLPFVTNRTVSKLKELEGKFKIQKVEIQDLPQVDILINGTSIGIDKTEIFPLTDEYLSKVSWIFDMVYGDTNLKVRGEKLGCKIIDGREMLIYQGAKQFELFTGLEAPLEAMRKAIYLG